MSKKSQFSQPLISKVLQVLGSILITGSILGSLLFYGETLKQVEAYSPAWVMTIGAAVGTVLAGLTIGACVYGLGHLIDSVDRIKCDAQLDQIREKTEAVSAEID